MDRFDSHTYLKVYTYQSSDPQEAHSGIRQKDDSCKCDCHMKLWAWASKRDENPPEGSCHHLMLRFMKSGIMSFNVVAWTLLALFLEDIVVLSAGVEADTFVHIVLFISFIFFVVEITTTSVVENGYLTSFFFWCDVIGTISLIPDVPWLAEAFGMGDMGTQVLRAGRVARSGTRATRVLRLMRTFRLMRLIRIATKEESSGGVVTDGPQQPNPPRTQDTKAPGSTNVGAKLQAVVSQRVILLVILMLFTLPFLELDLSDDGRLRGLEFLERAQNSTAFTGSLSKYRADFGSDMLYLQVWKSNTNTLLVSSQGAAVTTYDVTLSAALASSGAQRPDLSGFRDSEVYEESTNSGQSRIIMDISDLRFKLAYLNIILTLFIVVLFGGGSYLFVQDAEHLFFKPIERMIRTVTHLAKMLFAFEADESPEKLDETFLIEAIVAKLASLFAVRLNTDGVRRKVTFINTPVSIWKVTVEEESIVARFDVVEKSSHSLVHIPPLELEACEELSSLGHCLESPTASRYFGVFLRACHAEELLLCYRECVTFQANLEYAHSFARSLYQQFISADSLNQVSLLPEEQDRVEEELAAFLQQHPVMFLMRTLFLAMGPHFARFRTRSFASQCLQQLANEASIRQKRFAAGNVRLGAARLVGASVAAPVSSQESTQDSDTGAEDSGVSKSDVAGGDESLDEDDEKESLLRSRRTRDGLGGLSDEKTDTRRAFHWGQDPLDEFPLTEQELREIQRFS